MQQSPIIILGIESSCDDTSAAIIKDGKILANIVANQDVHEAYGGVVPELASRAHQQNIIPVVNEAIKKAGISKEEISAVAFTNGPGLLGSLLVGSSFAKAFALGMDIPLIEVNHMHGHILAHFIEEQDGSKNQPNFPFLCLTVSGGHTQIVKVSNYFKMEVLGETIDDAAGEAFDKVSKMLSLPYPGGPVLDKKAQLGDPNKFKFTHPKVPGLNYSFSGLKTSVLYFLKKEIKINPNFINENLNDICASVQKTIVDVLMIELKKAITETGIQNIAIAGGVSANSELRKRLASFSSNHNVFVPKFEYCTDHAAMIAITGYYKFIEQDFTDQRITPNAR
ncbi:MAG: tRNA (adenosine(37)-N6)-threonylcarbamoyltransferase complex transferase subunit TsaD, partial [Vicingaceae bacterium]